MRKVGLAFLFLIILISGCTERERDTSTATPATSQAATDIIDTTTTTPMIKTTETTTTTTTTMPIPTLNLSSPMLGDNMRWRKFPVYVYIDNETCKNYMSEINQSLNTWNAETAASFEITDDMDKERLVVVRCYPETMSYYLDEEDYVRQKLGEALTLYIELGDYKIIEGGVVNMYKTTLNCIRPLRYIHEFGHILGLNHTDDKTDIMYPYEDCSLELKQETIDSLEKLYAKEIDDYVGYLYETEEPICPVNTTKCEGRCWPNCPENYTMSCEDFEFSCEANWTAISDFEWDKFEDYKIYCAGEYYPPCARNGMLICSPRYKAAYCMEREEFEESVWWAKCSDKYNIYCDGHCQKACLGTSFCYVDDFYCEDLESTNSTNTTET